MAENDEHNENIKCTVSCPECGAEMICTHKISVQSSKPSHIYPIIRLPREFQELIGSKAEIYQTVHDRKLAFLVVADKEVDNCCTTMQNSDVENRLYQLESQIAELKSLILQKASEADADKENKRSRARFEPASWPHRYTILNIKHHRNELSADIV